MASLSAFLVRNFMRKSVNGLDLSAVNTTKLFNFGDYVFCPSRLQISAVMVWITLDSPRVFPNVQTASENPSLQIDLSADFRLIETGNAT